MPAAEPSRVIARTGSTEWRQSEPKTIELYNTDRGPDPVWEQERKLALMQRMMAEEYRSQLGMMSSQGKELADLDLLTPRNPYDPDEHSDEEWEAIEKERAENAEIERKYKEDEADYYNTDVASKSDKKTWRKEIKQFDRFLRKDKSRIEDNFDQLLKSGAVWADPDDVGGWKTSVPLNDRQLKSIAEGFNEWQKQVFGGDPYYMQSWQKSQDRWRDTYRDLYSHRR